MTHHIPQQNVHPPHRNLHHLLLHRDPDRQRVHEQPQYTIRSLTTLHPPEQHSPKHHILPARRLPHNPRPRQMTQTRRTYPQLPCAPSYPSRQRPLQQNLPFLNPPPAPRTSSKPKGAVGSSMSPNI